MNPIILKSDRRFKPGNIKRTGSILRGHPDAIMIKRYECNALNVALTLNPPMVITSELTAMLKECGFAPN